MKKLWLAMGVIGAVVSATMTFGSRGGRIHEVEAFPFVTFAYGQGDGWTRAEAR